MAGLAILAGLLAASASLGAGPVLIEGFEDLAKVKAVRGAGGTRVVLAGVKGTPYVTQGAQAGLVSPAATVSFPVSAEKLAAAKWLRIDTVALQSVPHPVRIQVVGADFGVTIYAYVQPGSDTLALPLAVVPAKAKAGWPPTGVVVSLKNPGETALSVDNVRLEPAAKPPAGAVLLDYGPPGQVVWPGFAAGRGQSDPIEWDNSGTHRSLNAAWPDPLGRDFVGPRLTDKAIGSITLGSGTKSVSAWLWLTHYSVGTRQPMAYEAKFGRRALMRAQLTRREMLGPRGLLEGAGAPWTPQWFSKDYADHFVQMVQVTAGGTRRRVDLVNCQLAAVAMVPLAGRNAMMRYVKQVERDLVRYRRQFVVGAMRRTRCSVAPMAVEQRAGAMVFSPPAGRGFEADWVPRSADRVTTLNVTGAGGMDIVIPLAVVPLRPGKGFSTSVPLLRSATGRILAFEKPGLVAYCTERVARVASAAVEFPPWVLVPPARLQAGPGDVCPVVLKGRIRHGAPAGRYTGTLAITRSGLRTDVSLAMNVLGCSVDGQADPIIGARNNVRADDFYRVLSTSLSPAQQTLATAKVRRLLLTSGIDALSLPGVSVSSFEARILISSSTCATYLRGFPADITVRGRTLLDASRTAVSISKGAAKMLSLANAAKVKKRYLLWRSRGSIAARDKAAGTALATAEKGSAMMSLSGSALLEAVAADASALSPWSALLVTPDAKGLGKGVAGALQGGVRDVYLYSPYPDRYVCGFYSCAVGASGSYVYGVPFTSGGAYSGCSIDGGGMLALKGDGSLAPTVALLRLWQARSDYQLMKGCEMLLKKHGVAAPSAAALAAVLKKITAAAAAHRAPTFNRSLLRSTVISPETMEIWRAELFKAAEKVLQAVGSGPPAPRP